MLMSEDYNVSLSGTKQKFSNDKDFQQCLRFIDLDLSRSISSSRRNRQDIRFKRLLWLFLNRILPPKSTRTSRRLAI